MATLQPRDVDTLRERLQRRRDELRAELATVDEEREQLPSRTPQQEVEDSGEEGEQRSRETVRDAERERDFVELRDIAAALERIAVGGYGQCVDCGGDIPLARLHVQPSAARCVGCQTAYEKQQGAAPHASPLHEPPTGT
jgi:RNA polymerase-binding transcription factor